MVFIDGSMWWIVWPLLFGGLFSIGRGRRRRKGPRGQRGRWDLGESAETPSQDVEFLRREMESQRIQLEEMAGRLAELENRADFTERLLTAPHEKSIADSAG